MCAVAVRRRRSSKNATTPITNRAASVPPTAPAVTAMSGPVDDDDAGAETDWVAVVVLVMVDGVVVLVGVEVVDMPSIDILVGVVVPPPAVVVVVLVVVVLAVVVVAPTAAVVIVVVVELAMDLVMLSAVVGGRLLHKHCGGTVEQFCK